MFHPCVLRNGFSQCSPSLLFTILAWFDVYGFLVWKFSYFFLKYQIVVVWMVKRNGNFYIYPYSPMWKFLIFVLHFIWITKYLFNYLTVTALDRANAEEALLPIPKIFDFHEKNERYQNSNIDPDEIMADDLMNVRSQNKAVESKGTLNFLPEQFPNFSYTTLM